MAERTIVAKGIEYAYSMDGEYFHGGFKTREEAIGNAKDDPLYKGTMHIAQTRVMELESPINAEYVIEKMF